MGVGRCYAALHLGYPCIFHICSEQQRRLLSDWLMVFLVPRFFHTSAHEVTNKMAAKDVLFDYLLQGFLWQQRRIHVFFFRNSSISVVEAVFF